MVVRETWFGRAYNAFFAILVVGIIWGGLAFLLFLRAEGSLPEELQGIAFYSLAAFGLLFGLLMFPVVGITFRRSNWLVRAGRDWLLIKIRSDSNAKLPEPHPIAVSLRYEEVEWARWTREVVTRHGLNSLSGSQGQKIHILDLKLRVDREALESLRKTVDAELAFKPPAGHTLAHHYPVRLDGDVLRVQWRWFLRPTIPRLLNEVGREFAVEKPLDLTKDFTREIPKAEIDDEVLELARRGETLAAIGLAQKSYGMSLTEAKAFVEGLVGRD